MEEIQFSLIKKLKIGRPEHSLTPRPPTSDSISFLSSFLSSELTVPTISTVSIGQNSIGYFGSVI